MEQYILVSKWGKYFSWPSVGGMKQLYAEREENGYKNAFLKAGTNKQARILVDPEEFWRITRKKSE